MVDVSIATANTRRSAKWQNKKLSWTQFVDKLKEPVITKETLREYRNMTKDEKSEVKDVGGFVGGYLEGGSRKHGSCKARSMITLDADSAQAQLGEDIEMTTDYEFILFSTHSHTEAEPRYRVIIPLSREVTPDEYVPIALKIADDIGMDNFDPTGFQNERLFYWPSVSADAEYIFQHRQGKTLDPDSVLRQYRNWQDVSEWPSLGEQYIRREEKTQGDPLEKPGVIGAFNRVYNIPEVIDKFLADEYKPAGEGRYTYTGGHTAAGLVIYDDGKFAYSNHATDPASGQLLSAFDLVRVHRFGALDSKVGVDVAINKLPSYTSMCELATKDDLVKVEIGKARISEATEDFKAEDTDWLKKLDYEKKGAISKTTKNIEIILENDPKLKDGFGLNEFSQRVVLKKDLPWREIADYGFWTDGDSANLRVYLETHYGIYVIQKTYDAFEKVIERNKFNPVRDYLDGLVWDGAERVDTLLVTYLGAEDTKYVRTVTRKFLCGAVARIYQPGVKFDYALVTTGAQGIGKTMLINKLGGEWFNNSLMTVQGKDAYEALIGSWLLELGEMTATKKADIEAVKHFISKQEDSFRPAYGRVKIHHKRQCVFWGTSNETEFLRDRTGNRRFWPVQCGEKGGVKYAWDMEQTEVDQIWAEAVHRWQKGEMLALSAEENALAVAQQIEHTEDDDLLGTIEDYLSIPITNDWYERSPYERRRYITSVREVDTIEEIGNELRERVCVIEIWVEALGGDQKYLHPIKASQIRKTLHNVDGWDKHKVGKGQLRFGNGYGRQVAFTRKV